MSSTFKSTCFSCGYDLTGINEPDDNSRCPECGQNILPPYRPNIAAERNRRRDVDQKMLLGMCIFITPVLIWITFVVIGALL